MGQKKSLLTIKNEKFQKNLYNSTIDNIIAVYMNISLFKFFFWQKKIFLTNILFFINENKYFITFFIFFRVAKLIYFFGKKCKKIKQKYVLKYNNLKNLYNAFKFFKKNLIFFKFINLNFYLKNKVLLIKLFFKKLKKKGLLLFPRRYNFFLDFIQLTILLLENRITLSFFINIIVEIFKILQKKNHSKFLSFIDFYFNGLIKKKSINSILGIKLIISGKLKGKPRSTSYTKVYGTVPIQTLKYNIEYTKAHAFTIYGVFGIKLLLFRNTI